MPRLRNPLKHGADRPFLPSRVSPVSYRLASSGGSVGDHHKRLAGMNEHSHRRTGGEGRGRYLALAWARHQKISGKPTPTAFPTPYPYRGPRSLRRKRARYETLSSPSQQSFARNPLLRLVPRESCLVA